jgi:hypothetical protein
LFAALFAWSTSVTPLQATTASPSINPIEMTAAYKAPLSRTVGRHLKFSRFPFVQFQFPPKTWRRSCAGAIFIGRVSGSFQSALPKLTTPIRSQRPHKSSRNSLPTWSAETSRSRALRPSSPPETSGRLGKVRGEAAEPEAFRERAGLMNATKLTTDRPQLAKRCRPSAL